MQIKHTHADVIIIGGGIGGLIAGAILSKWNYNVCIIEKNIQLGGCLQSFGIQKKLVESSVHYIGSMDKGQTLHTIFNYLGILPHLELQKLDLNCFDKIRIVNDEYSLVQGFNNFIEKLSEVFPHQKNELITYTQLIQKVCNSFPLYNLQTSPNEEKYEYASWGLKETMEKLFSDKKLISVLCGSNLLHVGAFETLPFTVHALIQGSYIQSSYKFSKGSAQLAKLLANQIQQHHGEIIRNTEVKKIIEYQGKIQYIETLDGKRFHATHFISSIHPQHTFSMLQSNLIRPATYNRIREQKNSEGCIMLHLILKSKTIPYQNHNTYYSTTPNVWCDEETKYQNLPTNFGIFFNPDKENPSYCSSISIMGMLAASAFHKWVTTFNTTTQKAPRPSSYQTFKNEIANYFINTINQIIPHLKENILTYNCSTPLTYRDFLYKPNGTTYGYLKNINDPMQNTMSTRTKISNLFLTGENINLHGILGVTLTSILATSNIIGFEKLVSHIRNNDESNV